MKVHVTHEQAENGKAVRLCIGNIGEDVFIPDSAFTTLPVLRNRVASDADMFPLFSEEGRQVEYDLGNINGESVSLSAINAIAVRGLVRGSEGERIKARLEGINRAVEKFANALNALMRPDEAESPLVLLPSPDAAPELYRYAESASGGSCFILLGVDRIGSAFGSVRPKEVLREIRQTADKLVQLRKDIERNGKRKFPFPIFVGRKGEEELSPGLLGILEILDVLDGKKRTAPEEPSLPLGEGAATSPAVTSGSESRAEPTIDDEPDYSPLAPQSVAELPSSPQLAVPQPVAPEPAVSQPPAEPVTPEPEAPQPPVEPLVPEPEGKKPSAWTSIPSDQQALYAKPDNDMAFLSCGKVSVVAASVRGRSHAHKGAFREDDFSIHYDSLSHCAFLAVSDGAGSAKYSRKGSEIAVRVAVKEASNALTAEYWKETEASVRKWHNEHGEVDGKNLGIKLYPLIQAAHKARTEIVREAGHRNARGKEGAKVKDYAATLILTIVKEFDFGWFVATYWVGDGGVCVYKETGRKATLMGEPDSGEFAGETHFLTSTAVWVQDAQALIDRRLRFNVFNSFKAVVLMTDGVSDPKFGGDAGLADFARWDAFWADVSGLVSFERRDETVAEALGKWLDFSEKGEFDDRTLVILY